jgi:hypothetical protein
MLLLLFAAGARADTITVNGAQVPSTAGMGRLVLQNATTSWPFAPTTSDPFSSKPAGAYTTTAIPGTYDLYYKVITPGPGVPRTPAASWD